MLNLGLGVNSRHSVSLYDADAQAFINATALTGTTEKTAVNNLVKNLKSYGLWSKMKAIYPFVSDQKNLSSYTEDFNSVGWQKAGNTVTVDTTIAPDGTTTADTVNTTSAGANYLAQQINVTPSTSYVFSFYAIKGTNSTPKYRVYNNSGSADIVAETSYGSLINTSTWTRVTVSFSTPTNCTSLSIYLLANGFAGTTILWGSQLEIGSTATTYQKTSTTASSIFVQQFKYNLKDARDLDAAFRLAFNGTWTYSKQGATPNGVNGYANTYLTPSTSLTLNSSHLSYYSRTNTTGYITDIGADNGSKYFRLRLLQIATPYSWALITTTSSWASSNSVTDSFGFYLGSRTSSTKLILQKNANILNTSTVSETNALPPNIVYLGALNSSNIASEFSNRQVAFSTIGDGLTDTEATNLYTSVQLFQQELARYVGVPIVSDANAQAFLDAAVITDQTQANAVNTLVTDLKTYGLWTKMKAIYPFVGGTATTHKWNLKDPRDLDAAYRLAFSGAWTHSSTGALPNGANAYADSFLIPSTALTLNNTSFGYYSRTNSSQSPSATEMAVGSSGTQLMYLRTKNSSGNAEGYSYNTNPATVANANSQGLYNVSRISDSSLKLYKNGSSIASLLTTQTGNLPSNKFYLGAVNYTGTVGEYSNKESAFAYIGDGFSDTEAANLYTAVNKFQTSLNRQIP
jgi:hypothetical protein